MRQSRREMDRKRQVRLLEKAQKAHVEKHLPEVLDVYGWNKRFHLVQRLRSEVSRKRCCHG